MVNREVIQPEPENPRRWADVLRKSRLEAGKPLDPEVEPRAESAEVVVSRDELDVEWTKPVAVVEVVPAAQVERPLDNVERTELMLPRLERLTQATELAKNCVSMLSWLSNLGIGFGGGTMRFDGENAKTAAGAFIKYKAQLENMLATVPDEELQSVSASVDAVLASNRALYDQVSREYTAAAQAEQVSQATRRWDVQVPEAPVAAPQSDFFAELRRRNLAKQGIVEEPPSKTRRWLNAA